MAPFTKRHQEAIRDGRIRIRLGKRLRRRLLHLVTWHGGGTGDWHNDSMLPDLFDRLVGIYGVKTLQAMDEDFTDSERHNIDDVGDFILGAYPTEVFDVLEIFRDMLHDSLADTFTMELNEIMQQERIPWLLVDGQILRMDEDFLKIRLADQAHDLLDAMGFGGALQEFQEARNDLSARDAKECIREASNAFESTIKTALGLTDGTASALIDALREAGYFNALPEGNRLGFGNNVLKALPFMRNRLGGHGQGAAVQEVPEEYAELALNLSATFITFIVRRHQMETMSSQTPPISPAPVARDYYGPDEPPF